MTREPTNPLADMGDGKPDPIGSIVGNLTGNGTVHGKNKGGRPSVPNRRRLVLYLSEDQVKNIKLAALEKDVDVSALARAVFEKAGY